MSKANVTPKKIAVIMAGGLGARFWPVTSDAHPKYALKFNNKQTLLSATYTRLTRAFGKQNVYVITVREHRRLIQRLLPQITATHIFNEPLRRNTAAAITYMMLALKRRLGAHLITSFFPADHAIQNSTAFKRALLATQRYAAKHTDLVVLGIRPTYAATGYGYIAAGKKLAAPWSRGHRVRVFVEKPELKSAKRYIRQKNYTWNSGMFTWSFEAFDQEMHQAAPRFYASFLKAFNQGASLKRMIRLFKRLKPEPIDRLLLERAKSIVVFPATFDWDDIGTWDSIRRLAHNKQGNVLIGNAYVESTHNCVVVSDESNLAVVGLRNLAVVKSGKQILVCDLDQAQSVTRARKAFAS